MRMCHIFFFFSSRRRHTRLQGDWSSDVCSSDLSLPCRAADAFRHAPLETLSPRPVEAPLREGGDQARSEEHTSELQSPCNLVCRLLLEKKKNEDNTNCKPNELSSRSTTWHRSRRRSSLFLSAFLTLYSRSPTDIFFFFF